MGVAIYARKSTESEDRQVQSLEDQLTVLRKLAASSGILVSEEIIEARSAKEPGTRPGFERMVAKIRSGEITGLLVWQMNRLSRNMVDGGVIAHLLQTGKLQFIHTADRSYRPNDSVLLLAIENGVSTEYIQGLSRNVKRGMEGKAMRGWQNGRAPFGYVNNLLTKEIEPDPERFELLKRGWEMLESGSYTVADVGRELHRLGIIDRMGKRGVGRSVLYWMFRQRFYCGEIRHRGQHLPGRHIPMVSVETFERVQKLLGAQTVRHRDPELKHPYAGLMRCGVCGCLITAETKLKRDRNGNPLRYYTYYHCTGMKGCRKSGLSERVLDRVTADLYDRLSLHPSFDTWAIKRVREQFEQTAELDAAGLESLSAHVSQLERRLARVRDLRIDGELTAEEFSDERQRIEFELKKARADHRELESATTTASTDLEHKLRLLSDLRGKESLSTQMKRGFIRCVAEAVRITRKEIEFSIDPLLKKIAPFELAVCGSQSEDRGGAIRPFPNWLGNSDVIRYSVKSCNGSVEIDMDSEREIET